MLHRFFRYFLFMAVLVFSCLSCNEDDPSINASRLRVKLTDASSLVLKELYVEIKEISVFLVDTTGQGEWTDLQFSGKSFDVLKLNNGKTVQIVDQYVSAHKVLRQVKLTFGTNNRFVTNTGKSLPLQLPAELSDGMIIDAVEMELRTNTIYSLIIDLNAAVSVRESNGEYFLYPVIRAFPETYGGKIKGYVAPLVEANPFVTLVQDTDTLFTYPVSETAGSDTGMFQFIGLNEGEWEVHIIANPETNYSDTVLISTVEAGKTTELTPKPIRLKPLAGN